MKKRVRSLLVFTTVGYRILAFVVLPVLCIAAGYLSAAKLGIPGYFLSAFFLVFGELMLDFMIFGGICAKDVSHLDYLKGSSRGELVIRRALTGNIVRMVLSGVLIFAVNQITYQLLGGSMAVDGKYLEMMAVLLITACAVVTGMSVIGRFFDGLQAYYILSVIATLLEAGVLLLMIKINMHLLLAASAILLVGTVILNVQIAMKHIKESYYDKTVADGD